MRSVCVLTTVPRLPTARKLAKQLLDHKLAACVSLIPAIESHFMWNGKKDQAREIQLLIKTSESNFKKIESFFKENHPYDVPELISFPIKQISRKYAKWMQSTLK